MTDTRTAYGNTFFEAFSGPLTWTMRKTAMLQAVSTSSPGFPYRKKGGFATSPEPGAQNVSDSRDEWHRHENSGMNVLEPHFSYDRNGCRYYRYKASIGLKATVERGRLMSSAEFTLADIMKAHDVAMEELHRAEVVSEEDPETGHISADVTLIRFLQAIGFDDLADAWSNVDKWYA